MKTTPTDNDLRAHYANTALARMGVPFERGMQMDAVRIAVNGAAVAARRVAIAVELDAEGREGLELIAVCAS